jgi:hypothetical protein
MTTELEKHRESRFKQNPGPALRGLRTLILTEAALVLGLLALRYAGVLTFLPEWVLDVALVLMSLVLVTDLLSWPNRKREIGSSYVVLTDDSLVLEYAGKRTALPFSFISLDKVIMHEDRVRKLVLRMPYGKLSLHDYEDMDGLHRSLKTVLRDDTTKRA